MLRSIDFKTMPYLFTDKAGTCLTVEFDGRELDDIYKQVKAMYDLEHPSDGRPIEPMEPGWYMTRDGEDLLSFDGDAWHIHYLGCGTEPFADGDLETMDWNVVKRTFDANSFPLVPVNPRKPNMTWESTDVQQKAYGSPIRQMPILRQKPSHHRRPQLQGQEQDRHALRVSSRASDYRRHAISKGSIGRLDSRSRQGAESR